MRQDFANFGSNGSRYRLYVADECGGNAALQDAPTHAKLGTISPGVLASE